MAFDQTTSEMRTSDVFNDPRGTPGFRQYDPGVWTNNTGQFWDATGRIITDPTIKKPPMLGPGTDPRPKPTANPTTGSGWAQYDPGVWQNGNQFSLSPTGSNPTTREAWLAAHPNDKDVYGIGGPKSGGGGGGGGTGGGGDTIQPPTTAPTAPTLPVIPPFVRHELQTKAPDLTGAFRTGISGGLIQDPMGSGQALYDQLTKRASQSLNIDPMTDPIIAPQVNAAAASYDRAARNTINDTADSGNPYATGALQNARTQAGEYAGQQTAALQSQLVQNELIARRTEIQNALTEQGSLLTVDQQLALQRQLNTVDAALRKYQTQGGLELQNESNNNNRELGLGGLSLGAFTAGTNANLGQQQIDVSKLLGLLGASAQQQGITNQNQQFYSGLSQQDQQFLNNLALQYQGLNTNAGLQQQQITNQNNQFTTAQQNELDKFLATLGLNTTNSKNYWSALREGLL